MTDPEWRAVEADVFQKDDRDDLAVFTTTVDADSEIAEQLLLDPLPLLAENLEGVTNDWTVSLERVNAEEPVRRGPRKLIAIWAVIRRLRRVCGVVYRVPA